MKWLFHASGLAQFSPMIVLKKSTTSLTPMNLGMHEYWRSSRDYELSHKIHPFISISQCKSLWIFPKKERRQITDVSYI